LASLTAASPRRAYSPSIDERTEDAMRRMLVGIVLGLVAMAATAAGVENKWRLEFSGNAESDGRIVLELAPDQGEPMRATAQITKGRSENGVARDVRDALKAQVGQRYAVEVDDGEDVLVKKQRGERDFVITIVENSVDGVRIHVDAE
jgi:hypothetical protein